jgi:hypothetical protein
MHALQYLTVSRRRGSRLIYQLHVFFFNLFIFLYLDHQILVNYQATYYFVVVESSWRNTPSRANWLGQRLPVLCGIPA